jgi:hypothetical protein
MTKRCEKQLQIVFVGSAKVKAVENQLWNLGEKVIHQIHILGRFS